jgi:hypothetical protein
LVRLNRKLIKHHKCGPRRFPEERGEWRWKRSTHVRRRLLLPELRLPSSSSSSSPCVLLVRAREWGFGWVSLILCGRRGSCWVGCGPLCCLFTNAHRLHFVVWRLRVYETAGRSLLYLLGGSSKGIGT